MGPSSTHLGNKLCSTPGLEFMDCTVCPRNCYPTYIVNYYIKWVTTSWTCSIHNDLFKIVYIIILPILLYKEFFHNDKISKQNW